MTFIIPTAIHLMQVDFDGDARARGAFSEGQFATRNTKSQGSLPITGSNATQFTNSVSGGYRGQYWEFKATGSYDVSTDTKVFVWMYQHNAPNRLEIETVANNGLVMRLGSGTGSPPVDYITFQVVGQDTALGKERGFPVHVVLDMNVANEEAEVGTYDRTAVECWGYGTTDFNMGGSTNNSSHPRCFVFDTVKGGDSGESTTDIPRFTGTGSDWDDVITAMGVVFNTKITHGG